MRESVGESVRRVAILDKPSKIVVLLLLIKVFLVLQPLIDGKCQPNQNRCCGLRPGTGPDVGGSNLKCGGRQQISNYRQTVPPQVSY